LICKRYETIDTRVFSIIKQYHKCEMYVSAFSLFSTFLCNS